MRQKTKRWKVELELGDAYYNENVVHTYSNRLALTTKQMHLKKACVHIF